VVVWRAGIPVGGDVDTTPIRILIVDDHRLFAEGIRPLLEQAGFEVVGVAGTGAQARALLPKQPDVILLDLSLPDVDGVALGEEMLAEHPAVKILALTAMREGDAVRSALLVGFYGYLTKDMATSELVESIRAAAGGQVVIPHALAASAAGADAGDEYQELARHLTDREREVLALLADGAASDQIAKRLAIRPNTVRTHVQNILAKLGVHSRLEAASFAVRHGIAAPRGMQRSR
jgi:two-component system, NarL family, nitrate/nitrite response regulator NarL